VDPTQLKVGDSVTVLTPLVVEIVELLIKLVGIVHTGVVGYRALGSVTFGMTTTFNAEGASFLTLVSPPG
jgi:hypothetical protein|tara:strand:+ start:18418 stop:18627 length:210 start_codon:yes stop_codon:yes gene_type:complete